LQACDLHRLHPGVDDELGPRWLKCRKKVEKPRCKGFDSMVLLIWWFIWKERNASIFSVGHVALQPAQLVQAIRDEGSQ
jgi:hypothetical protein